MWLSKWYSYESILTLSVYHTDRKLTEFLRSRYLVLRVTGIPDKKAKMSLLALGRENRIIKVIFITAHAYASTKTQTSIYFYRQWYLVQDRGSLRPLSLAEKYQASNNITRHNVQVSEELRKKAGHFWIRILDRRAADIRTWISVAKISMTAVVIYFYIIYILFYIHILYEMFNVTRK